MLFIVGKVCIVFTVYIVYTEDMTDSATGPVKVLPARGDEDRRSLADRNRPRIFAEVVGQESAVDCLSGLIARGRKGRHILLYGAVGSGKTTLARIYARALNCQSADPRKSPCYACEACGASDAEDIAEFSEFNIKDYATKADKFIENIKKHYRPPDRFRYRILFFDEAHGLEKAHCDALLQPLESQEHPVVFLFATTEAEKLRPALRSRLFDLLIRPLPVDRSIAFLSKVAHEEGITHEPGALALLASLRAGFPRDLLLGLERVWEPDASKLTIRQVRNAFDLDQTEILTDYFTALADGDRDRAMAVMSHWREREVDKIRWIQAFLLHVYHNNILGRRLIVDGVIEAIPEDVRTDIVRRFCSRLAMSSPTGLAPFWQTLLNFWPMPETVLDETALRLRLVLFHEVVAPAGVDLDTGAAADHADHDELVRTGASIEAIAPSSGFGPAPAPYPSERVVKDEDGYLRKADVRRIINGASFLVQEYGLLFNSAFEIRPALLGVEGTTAVEAIAEFRGDLTTYIESLGGEVFASMSGIVRVDGAIIGRLVAHLRVPISAATDEAQQHQIGPWARAWRDVAGRLGGDVVEVSLAPKDEPAALKFHWRKVLDLCAALPSEVQAWNPTLEVHQSLLKLLRVRTRVGSLGPVLYDHPLVMIPSPLSDDAIADRCGNRLEPLSAFDDAAWGEVTTGWELQEFDERRGTRTERARRLDEIRQRFGRDTPEGRAEVARLVASWPSDPRRRRRRWRGWRAGKQWP